uniref:Uncharacterized protein n=1 Tax=Caenorhabditis tropicalis TaxID=1561998 RepID=A0A1I7U2N3_9PELO
MKVTILNDKKKRELKFITGVTHEFQKELWENEKKQQERSGVEDGMKKKKKQKWVEEEEGRGAPHRDRAIWHDDLLLLWRNGAATGPKQAARPPHANDTSHRE